MGTTMEEARQNRLTGIFLMCLGVACLSVNDALAKARTAKYSSVQILFLRNVIALPFAMLNVDRVRCRCGLNDGAVG